MGTPAPFEVAGPNGAPVDGYLVVPFTIGPGTRMVIVLHGTERNADEYCAGWAAWADRHDILVVCPQFDRERWPGGRGYILGNTFTGRDATGELNPPRNWSFAAVTAVHRELRAGFGLADDRFDLWGHSAGAQFAHRFALFQPQAPVRRIVAANSGWYTLPDRAVPFPYGLAHPLLRFTRADVERWTGVDLVLMRGERDVLRDTHLRTGALADAQGAHRYDRAACMLQAGRAAGRRCRWKLIDVAGAGHDYIAMAPVGRLALLGAEDERPLTQRSSGTQRVTRQW